MSHHIVYPEASNIYSVSFAFPCFLHSAVEHGPLLLNLAFMQGKRIVMTERE
eukprot:jgi/Psemu1/309884/fgenesh1_kg.563_\